MDGLTGCPKLQKLWLFSNRISTIDNLHTCGDLRELWLQDNAISGISSIALAGNPMLHTLALAANDICDFDVLLTGLRPHCSGLRNLSLCDPHFGSNVVVNSEGYEHFIMAQFPQLEVFDGLDIQDRDKRRAEEAYVSSVVEFNDQLALALQTHEQDILGIDSKRNQNLTQADTLRAVGPLCGSIYILVLGFYKKYVRFRNSCMLFKNSNR